MRTQTTTSRARRHHQVVTAPLVALAGLALVAAACGAAAASRTNAGGPGANAHHPEGHLKTPVTAPPTTAAPVTTAPTTTAPPLPAAAPGLVVGRVTVVGDSVTVDAQPALQAVIPGCIVYSQVGEQWDTGLQALAQLRSEGQLGSVVVVALGTNGTVSAAQFVQMMSVLQGVSRVVFVTNHAPDYWEAENNAMFKAEVPHYPTARIAEWDAAARANPSWMYSDGTHMPIGGPGAQAFAALVKAQI